MTLTPLLDGWRRFRAGRYREQSALFAKLANEGQQPIAAVVACCDSRVDPVTIFDCDPGDIFVVRNVANLVPPYEEAGAYHGTSAALEFAVRGLEVKAIVVLGHALCGGIRALFEPPPGPTPMRFLSSWMELAAGAKAEALAPTGLDLAERLCLAEQHAVRISVQNLGTFPTIRERVQQGRLRLYGLHFDLRDGALLELDAATGRFGPPR